MKNTRPASPPSRLASLPPVSPVPTGGSIPLVSVHLNALLKKVKPQ